MRSEVSVLMLLSWHSFCVRFATVKPHCGLCLAGVPHLTKRIVVVLLDHDRKSFADLSV